MLFQPYAPHNQVNCTLNDHFSCLICPPIDLKLTPCYWLSSFHSHWSICNHIVQKQLVYYCSRALRRAEERYPKMEKLILALVTTSRKLRPYFQAHTVEVPTKYPMKQILHKPETSGRLMKWAIELSEFDIRYKPRTAVKG